MLVTGVDIIEIPRVKRVAEQYGEYLEFRSGRYNASQ